MIQQYLNMLRRWIWLLVLAGLGSGAVAYWITKEQPPTYEAISQLIVGPGIDSINPNLNDLRAGGQLMNTYAELAITRPVLESVIAELQTTLSADVIKKMIVVRTNADTQILSVQVRGIDAAQVVSVANAVANRILALSPAGEGITSDQVKSETQAQIEEIKGNIAQNRDMVKQLEGRLLLTENLEEQRLLFDQLNQLRMQQTDTQRILVSLYDSFKVSNTNQIKIIELAVTALVVDSNLLLTTMMAALAGLILTLTLVLAFEYFDDTIRKANDLAYTTGIPILATIARHKHLQGIGRERFIAHTLPESRAAESYRVLSSKLLISRFLSEVTKSTPAQQNQGTGNTNEPTLTTESTLRSVVISGTQPNENVSEIAANLAVLLAQTGHRVILVDAYLHRPSIHHLFGIPEQRGLADILLLRNLAPKAMIKQLRNPVAQSAREDDEQNRSSGFRADLHEAAALVSVEWAPGLQILPSGAQPTNPFELLVSPHMVDLIKSLEKQADLVIIAASPLLESADSLILASRTDGVVVVARSGKTRRDTIKEIVNALHGLNANILGAILDQHKRSDVTTIAKQNTALQQIGKKERQVRSIASA